ncbi:hypothetical protein ACFLV1_00740, partial [Chloroflexota bacterium]
MSRLYQKIDLKKRKDITVLSNFISVFCREKHRNAAKEAFQAKDERLSEVLENEPLVLCEDCNRLFSHGVAKLLLCTYDPKPMCKKCLT